jgi:hypothetical protein
LQSLEISDSIRYPTQREDALAEEISAPVARCPNPKCGKPISRGHRYSWCTECGEQLPASIQARLPHLREKVTRAANARVGPQGRAQPYLAYEAEAITKLYRRLILLVGGEFLLGYAVLALAIKVTDKQVKGMSGALILGLLVVFATSVFIAITAYKLSRRLRAGAPLFWALALFLPWLNVLSLLVLSSSATSWCRRHGIKVGLLGPTRESIEAIRRR